MTRFIVRRVFAMVLVIIAITIVTFLLLLGTGNQASRLAGKNATAAQVHQIEVKYGFDKPIYVQYVKTMGNIFNGTAYSYQSGFNVDQEILAGLPATASLALGAGVQPPNPSWGTMISDGINAIPAAFHNVLVPGIMLVLAVLSINVFGDGLRDALDPRAKIRVGKEQR